MHDSVVYIRHQTVQGSTQTVIARLLGQGVHRRLQQCDICKHEVLQRATDNARIRDGGVAALVHVEDLVVDVVHVTPR